MSRFVMASVVVLLGAWSASAQTSVSGASQPWVTRCTSLNPPGDCVQLPKPIPGKDGERGPAGPMGPGGPQGPAGRDGRDGVGLPPWPRVLAPYDFLTGPTTLRVTVPKQDGQHDKLLYRPGVAALVTRDADGRRCVQVANPFHADMPFTAVTIDAERTFSWHDATGYWSEPWDVSLPCVVF